MNLKKQLFFLNRYLSEKEDIGEQRLEAILKERIVPKLEQIFAETNPQVDKEHRLKKGTKVIHYTTLYMLISALQDEIEKRTNPEASGGFIRMYDSFHLNDPEEGQYLISHTEETYLSELFLEENRPHAYIASFIISQKNDNPESNDADDLKYWRSYGDEGRGVSIQFPIERSDPALFRRILYGKEAANNTLEKLNLQLIWQLLSSLEPKTIKDNQTVHKVLAEIIRKNIDRILYLYKSDAYYYEKECRIVKSILETEKDKRNPSF